MNVRVFSSDIFTVEFIVCRLIPIFSNDACSNSETLQRRMIDAICSGYIASYVMGIDPERGMGGDIKGDVTMTFQEPMYLWCLENGLRKTRRKAILLLFGLHPPLNSKIKTHRFGS